MIVLDTSALLYWTINRDALTVDAAAAIKTADQIIISSISIWEIGVKVQKEKLTLSHSVAKFVEQLQKVDGLDIMPVTVEAWLANLALAWAHRDPADRTIVATAQLLNCPLVTSDREMRSFYTKAIW